MITEKLKGYFDVKVYNAKTARESWKTKGDDETISFNSTFATCPIAFQKYAKTYTNKDGETRFAVQFKIGVKARWFDEFAKATTKPTNADLDKVKFEVQMEYNQLDGDAAQKEASGYWVNAIQFKKVVENPFSSWETADAAPQYVAQPTAAPQPTEAAPGAGDLPF